MAFAAADAVFVFGGHGLIPHTYLDSFSALLKPSPDTGFVRRKSRAAICAEKMLNWLEAGRQRCWAQSA
jgi:hypothetical protein